MGNVVEAVEVVGAPRGRAGVGVSGAEPRAIAGCWWQLGIELLSTVQFYKFTHIPIPLVPKYIVLIL